MNEKPKARGYKALHEMHKEKMAKREEMHRKRQEEMPAEATFQPRVNKPKQEKNYAHDEEQARRIKQFVDDEWANRNHVDQDGGNIYSKDVSDYNSDSSDKFQKDLRKVGYSEEQARREGGVASRRTR